MGHRPRSLRSFRGCYSEAVSRREPMTDEEIRKNAKQSTGVNFYDEDVRTARQIGDVDSFRELTDKPLIGEVNQ